MWLTSWWVAWLLNFYGFSHTNCMVFYRTPWTRYGIPWNCIGTSGNPMAFHGTLQYSLEFHGPPRKLHGISWHSMELHQYFMELRGGMEHSHGPDYDENCMLNFTFYRQVNIRRRFSLALFKPGYFLQNSTPGEFAHIKHSDRVKIIALKFHRPRSDFLSDVFAAVVVVVS